MTSRIQIISGILTGAILAVIDQIIDYGHMTYLILIGCVLVFLTIGVVRGSKLAVFWRCLLSVLVLYWAFGACLEGRTMEVGITKSTFGMALFLFALYGALPGLSLLRLWPGW